MVSNMLKLMFSLSVLSSLILTSSSQTCKNYVFPNNKVFANCSDLPQLSSFLHWNYTQANGELNIAFRHTGIISTNRWVAWAINPNNNLKQSMMGAHALVAILQPNGTPLVHTSDINSYATQLAYGNFPYPINGLTATYKNNEVTIFANINLPAGTKSLVHLWQDGPLVGSTPHMHNQASANLHAKETLSLV